MHLCTIRGYVFRRDSPGVTIYRESVSLVYISEFGLYFTGRIARDEAWLLFFAVAVAEAIAATPTATDLDLIRLLAYMAREAKIPKADVVLGEVNHA